ncbi:MAG: PIG-L family deacetylase [Chloroflexi bacterium]|nr:PIG-L family deacetylase [Chloroflexota bacterium]MBU1748496.1 PIG-L family deacetylase [Chloroflexota bacterium]
MTHTLLAVFAHPDDESFGPGGTLARYAAAGVSVHLVCATRGEAGGSDQSNPETGADLGDRREEELRCAAKILGLAEVHLLGYRDSGMAGSADNQHPQALVQADPDVLAQQVADLIRDLRPQVVLTSDPYGGYGHPDHIAVHRATLAAWERLAVQERPQKLYFTTFPHTALRWLVRLMPLLGQDPSAVGQNHDIDLRAVLAHEMPITTRIDVRATYDAKQQASACHASQLAGPGAILGRLPGWLVRRAQATETFHRVWPAFRPGEPIERDLFAGV